ncbi:uncharacterized protein LOC117175075 [Belonocnema kinseyi]|uniref:uncharacterized protein LOC117175075 n=1 Tax=Belonocnema kinseyi TaxID=2817044 RepID=UPI00143D6360|nr:uncharacterized protein LOC117175075 [Belonocnema kinseyi]
MEIAILFLLSVTLLNFTLVGAMHTQVENSHTRRKSHASVPENFRLVIQKLIGGVEAVDDAVEGNLYSFTTEHPNLTNDTFGHAIVVFSSGKKFFACLRKIEGYEYYGHDARDNCQTTTYRCAVKKGNDEALHVILSRYTQETSLLGGVVRFDFFNHLGVLFVGEMEPATPVHALPYKKRKTNVPCGPGSSLHDPLFLDL